MKSGTDLTLKLETATKLLKERISQANPANLLQAIVEACRKACIENVVEIRWTDISFLSRLKDYMLSRTSCFKRTVILTDSCLLELVASLASKFIVRGAIVVAAVDLANKYNLALDLPVIEPDTTDLVKLIQSSTEISEVLEKPVILRLPLFLNYFIGEPAECVYRQECYFNRNWKIKNAWTNLTLCIRDYIDYENEEFSNKYIDERSVELISRSSCEDLVILDRSIYLALPNLANEFGKTDIILINIFNRKSLLNILKSIRISQYKNIYVMSAYGEIIKDFIRCVVNNNTSILLYDVTSDLSKMLCSIAESCANIDEHILLVSLVYKFLNIFRNKDLIVISSLKLPREFSKGYYDTRLLLTVPKTVRDVGDIEIEYCDPISLKVFDESLPPGVSILCIERDPLRLSLRDLIEISNLNRTFIVSIVNNDSVEQISKVLKSLNLKYDILYVSNELVYELSECIMKGSKLIFVVKPSEVRLRVNSELCDRCGDCLEVGCRAITLGDRGVNIDFDKCCKCLACVVVCTRGAISLLG